TRASRARVAPPRHLGRTPRARRDRSRLSGWPGVAPGSGHAAARSGPDGGPRRRRAPGRARRSPRASRVIVVDTTILVYAVGDQHPLRSPCREVIAAIGQGEVAATTTVE